MGITTADVCSNPSANWYNDVDCNDPLSSIENPIYGFKKVSNLEIYDVILMHLGASYWVNHCALYVDKAKLLQIRVGHLSYISSYGNYYKQYTTGVYRWQGLIDG